MTLGGLGLFLYGITSLSSTLKKMASSRLSNVINRLGKNPLIGLLVGTGLTAIIQTSGGTSALTIGLVRAGVMSFEQASAVIIGANIGTTITAFIVSIPFMEYFPLVLFLGSIILLFATKKKWSNIGELCFAFGAIFLGLWIVQLYLSKIAEEPAFVALFSTLNDSPWLGFLIGIVATICLQSSSAVVGVAQGLYAVSAGSAISLFGILPIIFGANIGTTSTAIFASIGGSKESKKVALFHVIFNVTGSLLFMGVIYIFRDWLSNAGNLGVVDASGKVSEWYVSPMIQIALCHLIFNLVTGAIFFALLKPVTKMINKMIPTSNQKKIEPIEPLDYGLMKNFPSEGLALAKKRTLIMFSYTKMMFETIKEYLISFKDEDVEFVHNIESNVDMIDRQLNEYLSSCNKENLSEDDVALLLSILKASKDIERIGDYGENLVNFYSEIKEKKDELTENEKEFFSSVTDKVITFIAKTIEVYEKADKTLGIEVIQERRDFLEKLDATIDHHFEEETTMDGTISSRFVELIYVDIVNCYERVASHCSNIAKIFGTDKTYVLDEEDKKRFSSLAEHQ
mgnify:FL=1